jgi:hypothetical protein
MKKIIYSLSFIITIIIFVLYPFSLPVNLEIAEKNTGITLQNLIRYKQWYTVDDLDNIKIYEYCLQLKTEINADSFIQKNGLLKCDFVPIIDLSNPNKSLENRVLSDQFSSYESWSSQFQKVKLENLYVIRGNSKAFSYYVFYDKNTGRIWIRLSNAG